MITMAQSAADWRNTHSHGSHAFTHTLTSTKLQPLCAKRQLTYITEFGINFYFTRGRGSKQEYPEKNPDSLPINRWYDTLEEKIQRPGQESNPHPPTLVISLLGQERMPRLTHWATDCRIRPSFQIQLTDQICTVIPSLVAKGSAN